jgi:hypothetical protein
VGAGEKLLAVQLHLLILGAAGTAADSHITQVCINQGSKSYRVLLLTPDIPRTAGRPGEGTTYQPGHRCRTGMFPGVPHSRLDRRGLPPSGSQHQNGCLHVIECNGHGISLLAEEASSPYGATDRGRSSCPNQASHGSIRYASATRSEATLPDAAQTALSRDQHGFGNICRVTLTVHPTIPRFNRR